MAFNFEFSELDDLDDLSNYQRRTLARFPASNHTSPLTYFPQRHILRIMAGDQTIPLIRSFERAIQAIEEIEKRVRRKMRLSDDPTDVYFKYLNDSIRTTEDMRPQDMEFTTMRRCLRVAIDELTADLGYLTRAHPALNNLEELLALDEGKIEEISNRVAKASFTLSQLMSIRQVFQRNHVTLAEGMIVITESGQISVYAIGELFYFILGEQPEILFLLNYSQVLMLLDTVCARFFVRLTCELNDANKQDNLPPWSLISDIYQWGDSLIRKYRMSAYALIGEFESLVTGIFVTFEGTDPLELGSSYIASIMETAEEIQRDHGISTRETQLILNILREVTSINYLSEIFGLRKHWGNPMVDANRSGRAVQDKVEEELPIYGTAQMNLLASFNRMITLEFIKQHGRWPECVFAERATEYPLRRAWMKKNTRIPETHPEHQHLDWALMKFHNNCLIDSYEDELALISDKSVSVHRENLDAIYVKSLSKVKPREPVSENRRLILEYIRQDQLTILEILQIVMTNSIPLSWMANSASMKGTEMKHEKARIFAVLTYELRQYFAVTEDIIKNNVFKYNPHQTMTMSETELLKKLENVTKQLDPSNETRWLSVMHIIDFSKWNLRMRYTNTCLVFKSLDDFIGCPGLIERTHPLFSGMINVVQDPFNPPPRGVEETESDTIWRFHNCGWEGQRQKGWTLLTSALLSDLERLTGVHSVICGQGDNQTLLSQFPIPDRYRNPNDWIQRDKVGVRSVLDRFYTHLERECMHVGLKIKTAESCRSLSYFNYGKRLYFNGVELSMTLKRVAKILTEPNDSYPSSEFIFKTAEGASFAATLYSHPSILIYLVGRIAVAYQLHNTFLKNQLVGEAGDQIMTRLGLQLNKRFMSYLLKIPSSLGGVPQLSLAAFLYRGHPDPLCSDLVMLVLRARGGCIVSRKILQVVKDKTWFNKDLNRVESLILSPYSLNLDIPQSARSPLDKEILPALQTACGNNTLQNLFSFQLDGMMEALMQTLSGLNPFQPVVANDIYSRTLPGRRQTFVSGLRNTTSLGRLVSERGVEPMVVRIAKLEVFQLNSWIQRVVNIHNSPPIEPYQVTSHWSLAQWARDVSWGRDIVGITVPHPLEQFILTTTVFDVCRDQCNGLCPEHIVFVKHSEGLVAIPGIDQQHVTSHRSRKGSPYLGNTISEGIVQRAVVCNNPDETWRDVIRLNTVRRWVCEEGTNLDSMLIDVIKSRTNVDLSIINNATGIPSRISYNHRAALMATVNSCSVSSTSNMHTQIYISSNRMGQYSHGDVNYHMPFGPVFLCFQQLICLIELPGGVIERRPHRMIYHAHVRDPDVPIVLDTRLDIETPLNYTVTSTMVPIVLFSRVERLNFTFGADLAYSDLWSSPDSASRTELKSAYAFQLIADSFVKETIIRETVTQNLLSGYISRQTAISIGDISLVTPKVFIKSLSWNLLLLAPYNLWACKDECSFLVLARQFVDAFSNQFWQNFATSFSNDRLCSRLMSIYPQLIAYNLTRHTSGVVSVLKTACCLGMYQIFNTLLQLSRTPVSNSPFNIYAPSFSAARMLWSKYIELIVFSSLVRADISIPVSIAFTRDFSANILSCDDDLFFSVMHRVPIDLVALSSHLDIDVIYCPSIRFFDLQFPWVDLLRWNEDITDPLISIGEHEFEIPSVYPRFGDSFTTLFTERTIYTPVEICTCVMPQRSLNYQSNCFFATSGLLSKSHLRFLDIVCSLNLSLTGVIVLGSSTGTEALAFSSFKSCQRIYVNCYHQLSTFSPHAAGSYIPPAFMLSMNVRKLVKPSSAVIAHSDLTTQEAIDGIVVQTSGLLFTGITCDVEIPDNFSTSEILKMIENVLTLTKRTRGNKWCIIKVPIRCIHDLRLFTGVFGRFYSTVSLVKSSFSRPNVRLLHIVGMNRLISAILEPPRASCPSQLLLNLDFEEFFDRIGKSQVCDLFSAPRVVQESRQWLNMVLRNSLPTACHSYVKGWGLTYGTGCSRDKMLLDVDILVSELKSEARATLRLFNRTHDEASMPRSAILQLNRAPLNHRLNQLYGNVNRLELLAVLLQEDRLDLDRTIITLDNWLRDTHHYPMFNRDFVLQLDVTRFVNVTSRYLFEILGHIYGHESVVWRREQLEHVFHKPIGHPEYRAAGLFQPLTLVPVNSRPNLSWSWKRRSEIVFWMFAYHVLHEPLHISSPATFLLSDLHQMSKCLDFFDEPSEAGLYNSVWVSEDQDLSFLTTLMSSAFICIPVKYVLIISSLIPIRHLYRLPWSGLSPTRVIAWVDRSAEGNILEGFVDPNQFVGHFDERGEAFMGCLCLDCATEHTLVVEQNLTHSLLDKLSSLGPIETVRDKAHVL